MTDKQAVFLLKLVHENFQRVFDELEEELPRVRNQYNLSVVNPKLKFFSSELDKLEQKIEALDD